MPWAIHGGDLFLKNNINDPTFYASVIKDQNFGYYIFGTAVTILMLVIYFVKATVTVPSSLDKGNLIPHILALKCPALILYPMSAEYINFCYGFMTADLPWINSNISMWLNLDY